MAAMARRETQREPGVATKTRPAEKAKKPRLYKVLLHNDDYTTMEFVVWVLQTVFHHDETTATRIMLHIHKTGIGVAGIYPHEIAETRAMRVEQLARQYEYPLRSSVEEE
jgi:ATP-dependent Clp protease adaptor protein ClpS